MVAGYRFLPPQKRALYEGFVADWLLQPARAFVGTASEHYEEFRFPVIPEGEPFRCQLDDDVTDEGIMIVTPEAMRDLMKTGALTAGDRESVPGRLRAI